MSALTPDRGAGGVSDSSDRPTSGLYKWAPADVAPPSLLGVVGAGTMGAGIAQLGSQAGIRTLLHDPVEGAFERGVDGIRAALSRRVARNLLSQEELESTLAGIEPAATLADLTDCQFIIEAIPEVLELKLSLFQALAEIVSEDCVLATNTSSLSITEIAAGVPHPERVVGLHFFNPAPVMRLAEVVAGLDTGARAAESAHALAAAMGKRPIYARDTPGFVVNRVNRPFYLEALKLLQEGIATVEQIDRIVRMAGGYPMGPFELMDLVGIDTNHSVSIRFQQQSFGEPRYQPSALAAQMVLAGRLGRKSGRGWYEYPTGSVKDPTPPPPSGGAGRLVQIHGTTPIADVLRARAASAGFVPGANPWLSLDLTGGAELIDPGSPRAVSLHAGSLHSIDPTSAGFHALAPLGRLIETTRTPASDPDAVSRLNEFVRCLGCVPEPVGDCAGLVLGRVVAQVANEAAFLFDEGHSSAADIDEAMELGVNHPRGPFSWEAANDVRHLTQILDALHRELGEARYRAAPSSRRAGALLGRGEHPNGESPQ